MINFLRMIFQTRPYQKEIEECKEELSNQKISTMQSLRKVDEALKKNRDITYNIGRAMGVIR